jgi:uncharacterized protein (TIGR02145 family)
MIDKRILLVAFIVVFVVAQLAGASSPNFTGTGGKGITLAVLEPTGKGLAESEQWMLSLIQGSITGDFNKYSAMTIVDRQHVEKIMTDIAQAMASGHYSDETMVKIGHMTNARYILAGVVSRAANAIMFELAVTDAESGERKASYPPRSISIEGLQSLATIKAASADLLKQLGVELTAEGLEELLRPLPVTQIQAQTALAHGVTAQRLGTEVAALSYFYQAAALDTTLLEAANRSKIISANISSGNIGADVRNEILWRKEWIAKLTEFEESFRKIIDSAAPPYSFLYSTEIQRGEVDFKMETIDLEIGTNLRANKSWMNSIEQAANSVYKELNAGLNATKKRNDWGLGNWPSQGVTKVNPFESSFISRPSKQYDISIEFELLNDKNQVIGKQTLKRTQDFRLRPSSNNEKIVNDYGEDLNRVYFNRVNANDISDNLTIRIASVNGGKPENARFQIIALSNSKKQGTFTDSRDKRTYRTVEIFGTVWMAENLNYQTGKSWCYDNKSSNCDKYGKLYDWNTAMRACPAGWHLPSRQEWDEMKIYTVGYNGYNTLMSKPPDWDGTDDYVFSALPNGKCNGYNTKFSDLGFNGYWWTNTEANANLAYRKVICPKCRGGIRIDESKINGLSVRCVQD